MKSIQSPKSVLLVTLAALGLAVAGIGGARAESTRTVTPEGGVWMIVTHKVYDYARWRPVHDRTAAIKRGYGWKKCAVFAVAGDRNHVMVMEQFSTLDRAQAFADSTELRDEMAASGVSSQPEIRFVNALAGEP